jgi:hypothetical protein
VVENNRWNDNNQHQQPQPRVSPKPGQVHYRYVGDNVAVFFSVDEARKAQIPLPG